jgi:hypothetical protein
LNLEFILPLQSREFQKFAATAVLVNTRHKLLISNRILEFHNSTVQAAGVVKQESNRYLETTVLHPEQHVGAQQDTYCMNPRKFHKLHCGRHYTTLNPANASRLFAESVRITS